MENPWGGTPARCSSASLHCRQQYDWLGRSHPWMHLPTPAPVHTPHKRAFPLFKPPRTQLWRAPRLRLFIHLCWHNGAPVAYHESCYEGIKQPGSYNRGGPDGRSDSVFSVRAASHECAAHCDRQTDVIFDTSRSCQPGHHGVTRRAHRGGERVHLQRCVPGRRSAKWRFESIKIWLTEGFMTRRLEGRRDCSSTSSGCHYWSYQQSSTRQ